MAVTVRGNHLQFSTIALEAQGSLLAVANRSVLVPRNQPTHRGTIAGFTRSSRKRMLRKTARLDAQKAVFLTLTYPARYPDPRTAKNHLRAFLERIRRRFPDVSGIWKLEPQKRGAPHFHLLFFNLPFIPFWTLKHWWADVISEFVDSILPFVRVNFCTDRKQVTRYVAKYCGKVLESNSFFNNGSYLHDGPGPGRYWGVFAGQNLPWARRYYVEFQAIDVTGLRDILEVFTTAWSGVDPSWHHGVQVFSGESYKLFSRALTLGLACATHGTDVLYQTELPAAERGVHKSQSERERLNIRQHERKGVLRHQSATRLAHRKLLQHDLSCDLPLAKRQPLRATGIRRYSETFQREQGRGGSIGFTRGLVACWNTDLV